MCCTCGTGDSVSEMATTAAPPEVETAPPLDGQRLWFVIFVAWMAGLTLASLLLLQRFDAGHDAMRSVWVLTLMCFYLSLCNSMVPLPTAWIVLLAASPTCAVVEEPIARTLIVATCGTFATVMANLNEYHVLGYFARKRIGEKIRRTRLYAWAARWFDRAPFQLLTFVAFIPIPVDVVRWLAILRRYSRLKFAIAYSLGRWPRYVLFAGSAVLFRLTPLQILLIQVGLVGLALVGRVVWYFLRRT